MAKMTDKERRGVQMVGVLLLDVFLGNDDFALTRTASAVLCTPEEQDEILAHVAKLRADQAAGKLPRRPQ
jgi:hypothetical protein